MYIVNWGTHALSNGSGLTYEQRTKINYRPLEITSIWVKNNWSASASKDMDYTDEERIRVERHKNYIFICI